MTVVHAIDGRAAVQWFRNQESPVNSRANLEAAFEGYNRASLQAAVNLVGGDDRVDRIWVYTRFGGHSIEPLWLFRVGGAAFDHSGIASALGLEEGDPLQIFDQTEEAANGLLRALIESGDIPERIITEYDPHRGSASSQWDYEGVLEGPDDTPGRARDRWIVAHGGKAIVS